MQQFIRISDKVRSALANMRPVLALESTIISHGMPYPSNLQCARDLERLAENQGVTPATIAIMDGSIKVGLTDQDLQKLAQAGPKVRKVSRRDIGWCLARGETGATTVSVTMLCAGLSKIQTFATGGIGGVHRGVNETLDISADLT